jgi:hypothetical protein
MIPRVVGVPRELVVSNTNIMNDVQQWMQNYSRM